MSGPEPLDARGMLEKAAAVYAEKRGVPLEQLLAPPADTEFVEDDGIVETRERPPAPAARKPPVRDPSEGGSNRPETPA